MIGMEDQISVADIADDFKEGTIATAKKAIAELINDLLCERYKHKAGNWQKYASGDVESIDFGMKAITALETLANQP